jgi:hypothetical protein
MRVILIQADGVKRVRGRPKITRVEIIKNNMADPNRWMRSNRAGPI